MKISRTTWITFIVLAILSIGLWLKHSYSQLAFLNLTVDRNQALLIASDYINKIDPDSKNYQHAIVFTRNSSANKYLQRTLGYEGLVDFSQKHDFDLFHWNVRFFKHGQREGYNVLVSSTTGKVISFVHYIDATTAIDIVSQSQARQTGIAFLNEKFGFNPDEYELIGELSTKYDNRTDYLFKWEHKDVSIPWSDKPEAGKAKLTIGTKVSGNQILSFSNHSLLVPDDFKDDLRIKSNVGSNITSIVHKLYIILFTAAVFFLVSRKNHLAMHATKRFYITISIILFSLAVFSFFNRFESFLHTISTTSTFISSFLKRLSNVATNSAFMAAAIIVPALAGELLHFEVFPKKKRGSFLYYIQTTFFSRGVCTSIILGYFVCIIMLGIQSLLLFIGQTYWGVWVEYGWMTSLTTTYFPFLALITIAIQASLTEELLYRLFGISWAKKLFKNTFVAAFLTSILWGFAHSSYPVFPMWFRGVEVSFLGFFISFMYLRFGIIPVIVGHYLFDAFWHTAGYLFGETSAYYFGTSLFVLLLPLCFAVIAFIINRETIVRELKWHLNKHQKFNLKVLVNYLNNQSQEYASRNAEELKNELSSHGWDYAVVDEAVTQFNNNQNTLK